MLGRRSGQRGMFAADTVDLAHVGDESVYAFFARQHQRLFRDEDFAALYRAGGRPSVPPSLLAIGLLLQRLHGLSDQAFIDATKFDLRFKVALQLEHHDQLCAKSTLQAFRAGLVIHGLDEFVHRRTVEIAKQQGLVDASGVGIDLVLDTTPMFGRGAVKDTINLLADGVAKLLRALSKLAERPVTEIAAELGLYRYVDEAKSIKAWADIDWSDAEARNGVVREIVADADGLLALAGEVHQRLQAGGRDEEASTLQDASALLSQLLAQDIDRGDDTGNDDSEGDADNSDSREGPSIRRGTAADRIVAAHDPEMRHGRKSSSVRFEGHKISIGVDGDSGVILDCEVLPGNETDHANALDATLRVEETHGVAVNNTVGDGAYDSAATRVKFAEADRELVAKQRRDANTGLFPKSAFTIDLEGESITCPAGHTTTKKTPKKDQIGDRVERGWVYSFNESTCATCPLKSQCTRSKHRTIRVHPREALLREARESQRTPAFQDAYGKRSTVEHANARLVQLDVRQARYTGRRKSLLQLLMAAAMANITLLLTHFRQATDTTPTPPDTHPTSAQFFIGVLSIVQTFASHFRAIAVHLLTPTALASRPPTPTFRPRL